MNTTALKRFAQSARRKLMDQVAAKMEFVLTTDSAELREKAKQINELKKELSHTSREQLVERVAYTWFNRLAALRFMDANDYQPSGIRVVSPAEGIILPQVLNEAKQGNIPSDWRVDTQKVYGLLDGRLPASNPQNEAYWELLIAACNHLHSIFPFLFEAIDDYTELLLPDDLTSDFSIVNDVVVGMTEEDCMQVEVLGWLYQFYISEKKDEVFASKSKVKKEDIPAATQLFTPRWIVEYMVQNTVGKLWLQNRPKSKLRDHMLYYIESVKDASEEGIQVNEDYLRINSPEEITLLDQACGSGHILIYAFELLYKIYEEEGYNPSEIPGLILEKNLWGFEIDERAAEIAGFALLMKAREYHRRIFRKGLHPHILTFKDIVIDERMRWFTTEDLSVSDDLITDLDALQNATNFGSLIQPKAASIEVEAALQKVNSALQIAGLFNKEVLEQLKIALMQLQLLDKKFTCVVANPPYMGGGKMNDILSNYVKKNYPNSKADLFSCFIERSIAFTPKYGFNGMITMESWMFLSSFEELREDLLRKTQIECMVHMPYLGKGGTSLGINFGTSAFIFVNSCPKDSHKGHYQCIRYYETDDQGIPFIFPVKNERLNIASQTDFQKIPGSPIGYWVSKRVANTFEKSISLLSIAQPKQGLATSNNDHFIKRWQEVSLREISFETINLDQTKKNAIKWYPYNKGGEFRKWFGNQEFIVNWFNDGFEIRNFKDKNGKVLSRPQNTSFYFKQAITWTLLSSSYFGVRFIQRGFVFDINGMSCFVNESKIYYLTAFMCSKLCFNFLKIINPTLAFQVGDISKIPIIEAENNLIESLSISSINISKKDWNSLETSWDFEINMLMKAKQEIGSLKLEEAYNGYKKYCTHHFFQLHQNEEELNRQFIRIYGLQEELTPDVPLEEITILQQELDRKALAKLNKQLKREPDTLKVINYSEIKLPFIAKEVIAQFVSYSVGCMFGRYSLEKPGLILANQGETLKDYFKKIKENKEYAGKEEPLLAAETGKAKLEFESSYSLGNISEKNTEALSFIPDDDNVIPVLDDEWFEDDIVARFKAFLKASFGEQHFDRNLQFVEECLGKDIRRYFARDFYTDHVRRYKKRSIYWMFSSPGGSFNTLIYMHRYTPDTLSLMLNNYLRTYQDKLRARRQHLEQVQISGSAAEKAQALKETERIAKVLMELQEYEHDILYPLATQRINIDLDDGVLVNYNKFGKAVKPVPGLNDKATKKKVRGFDWIDVSEIRD